jgi:hypothetical protein
MIVEYSIDQQEKLIPFFSEHTHVTAIINSILKEGIGKTFVDDLEDPTVALLSHFSANFLAGDSSSSTAREMLSKVPSLQMILLPNSGWVDLMRDTWGVRFVEKKDFRTKLSSRTLNLVHIKKLKEKLPSGFLVEFINASNAKKFNKLFSSSFFEFFGSSDNFLKKGFGFCVITDDKVVCAAATGNPPFNYAFEINVMTDKNFRRKGLATIVSSYLIEYSLENGFDPRWDAANKNSADLALKLGYSNPEPYDIYFWAKLPVIILRKLKILKLLGLIARIFGRD